MRRPKFCAVNGCDRCIPWAHDFCVSHFYKISPQTTSQLFAAKAAYNRGKLSGSTLDSVIAQAKKEASA